MADSLTEALVHGEPGTGPVAGGAQLLLLLHDAVAVLVLPVPHPLQEFLPAQVIAGQALVFAQLLLHLDLGGDAGVVGAGHPQGGVALHPLEADQDVLEGGVHGMAHVELAGDVGGRHDNGEGLLVGITVALKAAVFLPHLVDAALHLLGFIDLGKFFLHLLHSFSGQKRFAPSCCSGRTEISPRYHLNFPCGTLIASVTGGFRRFLLPSQAGLRDDLPRAFGEPCTRPAPLCTFCAGTPSHLSLWDIVYALFRQMSSPTDHRSSLSQYAQQSTPPFCFTRGGR